MTQNQEKNENLPSDKSHQEQTRTFKVVVIGDTNVGKTCLALKASDGKFSSKTEVTIGVDFRNKLVKVESEYVQLQLWDTAGQERFRYSLVSHYYRHCHAVIFVYDVTRKSTFDNLKKWLDEFQLQVGDKNIPRLIIGNKCDLHAERQVRTSEAEALSSNLGIPLWETSAKSDLENDTIEAIFQSLAETLKLRVPLTDFPSHMSPVVNQHTKKGLKVRDSVLSTSDDLQPKGERKRMGINIKKKNLQQKNVCCR